MDFLKMQVTAEMDRLLSEEEDMEQQPEKKPSKEETVNRDYDKSSFPKFPLSRHSNYLN